MVERHSNHDSTPNPFATPKLLADNPPQPNFIRVDGQHIVVTSPTILPSRCIYTDEPATNDERVHRSLRWAPPFRLVIRQQRCEVSFCIGPSWRRARRRRTAFVLLGCTTAFVVAMLLTQIVSVWLVVIFCSLMFAATSEPLKIVRAQGGYFWIKGPGSAYLESCRRDYGAY